MTNILWVTADDTNMTIEHNKLLMEHYIRTGIWVKKFQFTDASSETLYQNITDGVDVIAFDERFPLHLLPRIIRKDKDCLTAVTIKLPDSCGGVHEVACWKQIEPDFMCTMTDVLS